MTSARPSSNPAPRASDGLHRYAPARAGLVAGAVASLLCNDSGVTAAAMIVLFACAWLLTANNDAPVDTAVPARN